MNNTSKFSVNVQRAVPSSSSSSSISSAFGSSIPDYSSYASAAVNNNTSVFSLAPNSVGGIQFSGNNWPNANANVSFQAAPPTSRLGGAAARASMTSSNYNSNSNSMWNPNSNSMWNSNSASSSTSFQDAVNMARGGESNNLVSAMLPVDGTSNSQPVVYDRYTFANRRSRYRDAGDSIRGDLAIIPVSYPNKLSSAQPHLDLRTGYINSIATGDSNTSIALDKLIYASSGNTQTLSGGVDLSGKFEDPNSPWYIGSQYNTGLNGPVKINTFM